MQAQSGADMTMKIADDQGVWLSVSGLQTKVLKFSALAVDGTHSDSPNGWREYLAAAGVKSTEIIADGVFVNSAADALIRAHFFAQSLANFNMSWPGFGTLSGPFLITNLSYSGQFQNEARFEIGLSSAGEIAFTPT